MFSLAVSTTLSGMPILSHTSPTRVGPFGGGVILLHGHALPYREALLGTASMMVGGLSCPILARRSDPRGEFLACIAPPMLQGSDSSDGTVTKSIMLITRNASNFTCAACLLKYASSLRAEASAVLSHRSGIEGDVVTLVGLSTWSHLVDSHGLHEQVTATIGGHDALPRFPGSRAVQRGNGDNGGNGGDAEAASGWHVQLAIPSVTAGEHELTLSIDRLWQEDEALHGTVAIDQARSVNVTVFPAVSAVSQAGASRWGHRLILQGSGFSRDLERNRVLIGHRPCAMISSTPTEIECDIDGHAASSDTDSGGVLSERFWTRSGLMLSEHALRTEDPECVASLHAALDASRCSAPNLGRAAIRLQQQILFPHHAHERHVIETNGAEHLHDRNEAAVLLSARSAFFFPPSDGYYSLEVSHGADAGHGNVARPCAVYLDKQPYDGPAYGASVDQTDWNASAAAFCSTGPRKLQGGRRYRFAFEAVMGGHQQLAVRAHVVLPDGAKFWFPAAPAEWFEQRSRQDTAAAKSLATVKVWVNGLAAVCRTPESCAPGSIDGGSEPDRLDVHRISLPSPHALQPPLASSIPHLAPLPSPSVLPLLPLLRHVKVTSDRAHSSSRQLSSTVCADGSCCVVLYRGVQGAKCTPVPVWDFASWSHPGGSFVTRTSHRLCNSIRYSWLSRSGQHALRDDPESLTATQLSGGATKVGEFIDPACGVSVTAQGSFVLIEQRWSALATTLGHTATSDLVVPRGASWLLDSNLTARTVTVRGTLRWDTSVDGLELSTGWLLVERGGHFELATAQQPMINTATIRILDNGAAPHPYLGSRFIATDGLASTSLGSGILAGSGTNDATMETITVTLSSDVEPGQSTTIIHNGQVCAHDDHTPPKIKLASYTVAPCPLLC